MSGSNRLVVTLVADGQARFSVQVSPAQDAESMRQPLAELTEHLQHCLGAPVIWFDRGSAVQPPVRLVLDFDVLANLGPEAFRIHAQSDAVTLCASTLQGLEHAVHYFLEMAFGVRWLWPGRDGTVTPKAVEVTWPLGETRHEPGFAWRRLWLGGSFWEESDPYLSELKFGGVSAETLEVLFRWHRRNRLGGPNIADGHRWGQICSPLRYGESHPEYFALVNGQRDSQMHDGKHGNQPCTSNPEVVAVVAEYIKAQFRARPELNGFSIANNDGSGFCECEHCREIDEWAQSGEHTQQEFDALTAEGPALGRGGTAGPRAITDRMVLFANQIAEQVAKDFPDKLLLMLIYSLYRTPPRRVRAHDNVIAMFCSMSFAHTEPAVSDAEMQSFEQLGPHVARLGVYDYFVNGRNGSLPRGFARTVQKSIRRYHALGGRYFATQAGLDFALGGLNYYYAARLLWDLNADVDVVLDDYCRTGFGNAAEPVRSYLQAFLDRWEGLWPSLPKAKRSMEALAGTLYPDDWRAERHRELGRALQLSDGDTSVQRRVRFLIEGLDFLDLLVVACEAATAMFAEEPVTADKVRQATETRAVLLNWVDQHRDGFWFSAAWFDYQRLTRSGLLGRAIPAAKKGVRNLLPERPEGCCAQKVPDPFSRPIGKAAS